jgi:hypothetical protein
MKGKAKSLLSHYFCHVSYYTFIVSPEEITLFKCMWITKLYKEENQRITEKVGVQNISKGNKRVPTKMVTTRTEDGHK